MKLSRVAMAESDAIGPCGNCGELTVGLRWKDGSDGRGSVRGEMNLSNGGNDFMT